MGTTNSNSNDQQSPQHIISDPDSKFQNLIFEPEDPSSNTSKTQKTDPHNSSTPRKPCKKQLQLSQHSSHDPLEKHRPKQDSLITNFDELSIKSSRIEKPNSIVNNQIKNYQIQKKEGSERQINNEQDGTKKKKKHEKAQPASVMVGIWIGLTLSIIIALIVIIQVNNLSIDNESKFSRDFPTWRGIAIWIFYVWMMGFDIYIFEKYQIRYRQILKIGPNHYPKAINIFRIAGFHSSVFVVLFLLYVLDITDIYHMPGFTEEYFALISWGFFAFFLFLPLPFLSSKGRFFLLSLFIDSLLSPFRGVTFPIILMTDQAVSMIVPLKDLEYTICYYTELDFQSSFDACADSNKILTLLIVAVSVCSIRMIQCMRQGYDKGQYFMTHFFFNTLKYATILFTAVFAFEYKLGADKLKAAWLLFAIVSSLFAYFWDLKMDWGLLERNKINPLLREKLFFGSPRIYYLILVGNLFMRLTWIITISPKLAAFLGNINLVSLVTGMIQIFRRGVWNLLRVEKEHLALMIQPPQHNQMGLKELQLQSKLGTVEKSLNLQIKVSGLFKKTEENNQHVSSELQKLDEVEIQKSEALVDRYNKNLLAEDMRQISGLMEQVLKDDSFLKMKVEDSSSIKTQDKEIYTEKLLKEIEQTSIKSKLEEAQEKYPQVERIKAELKQIEDQGQ